MKTINVLSIGNSFSQDAQRYLFEIARSQKENIQTVNLYIGGCSLERHFRNMAGEKREYALEINGNTETGFFSSIKEALTARCWDFVTLQQASHFSYDYETYQPYLSCLAEYVRSFAPKAKLLIHQTWAYESGSERIREHGFEKYEDMFKEIEKAYMLAAKDIHADGIIECGKALLKAQENGIKKVHRDTFHASRGTGRFILALTWYKYLTGNDISNICFNNFDEDVSKEEYDIAIKSINDIF